MSALLIRYSLNTALTSSGVRCVKGTVLVMLIPPLSFFLKVILGGSLLSLMPNPSNSDSIIRLWVRGLLTSRTMNMRLQVLATAITWRPRPYKIRITVRYLSYLAVLCTFNNTRQIKNLMKIIWNNEVKYLDFGTSILKNSWNSRQGCDCQVSSKFTLQRYIHMLQLHCAFQ